MKSGNEYEAYRLVTKDGERKKQWKTFASAKEAIEFHNSTADLSRGMILREVWEDFQNHAMGKMEVSTRNKLRSHWNHLEIVKEHPPLKEWTPRTIDQILTKWGIRPI